MKHTCSFQNEFLYETTGEIYIFLTKNVLAVWLFPKLVAINRVRMGYGNLKKSWNLIFKNPGLENLENAYFLHDHERGHGKWNFRSLISKIVNNLY